MPKPPTSFLIALLASGCTFTLSTLPLALMPTEEGAEHLSEAAVLTLAAGATASLIVGGATLAYAESQRTRQQGHRLNQQLQELESTLQEKNEKLVALALQTLAGSPPLESAAASPASEQVVAAATPSQAPPEESDPTQSLQSLLAWTSTPLSPPDPPEVITSELLDHTPPVLPEMVSEKVVEMTVPLPVMAEETRSTPEITLAPPDMTPLGTAQATPGGDALDHRPWQVRLMLQQARLEALETQLQEQSQARQSLEDRLANSLAREQSLRNQLEAQSERLMTLEAFQTQVKQQQQQIRQLHTALHKMKQQMIEKNKILSHFEEQQQELNNAKAALKGYHAVVKQNQELQGALQSLKAKLPSPEEMNVIYDLVQRQRQRIQHLEATLKGMQPPRRQPSYPEPLPPSDPEDYPPKWRDLIRESELYRF